MLRDRVLSALVSLPPLFLIIWLGAPWLFALVLAAAAAWASIEFYKMTRLAERLPLRLFGTLFSVLLIGSAYLGGSATPSVLALAAGLSLVLLLFMRSTATVLTDWAVLLAGILYVGLLYGYFVLLRGEPYGREWIVLVLACTFSADTAAYFVGRAYGTHKLAPTISPKKSWEGTVAGWLAAVAAALLSGWLLAVPGYPVNAVALGAIIGVVGQLGDLAESSLKRSAGVKDASTAIPGHGGLLDRMDSLAFAIVAAYHYIALVAKI